MCVQPQYHPFLWLIVSWKPSANNSRAFIWVMEGPGWFEDEVVRQMCPRALLVFRVSFTWDDVQCCSDEISKFHHIFFV